MTTLVKTFKRNSYSDHSEKTIKLKLVKVKFLQRIYLRNNLTY